ncbi:MAG TPA: type II CAAX endopeptidase family protein [bacterium]|nr:type II CAAX endopeptidase family protein [bacterium]HMY34973.1 type II CAAX endopeptidase family protein [bacterium]HMZ03470.1 type II CAAX endopeptidase family protein [bacterium]HNB08003.1 type II CAAX endopeptidase family protein [bacterium]HNB55363.1 type II CAAX endopeptidase family protein [bacterium]
MVKHLSLNKKILYLFFLGNIDVLINHFYGPKFYHEHPEHIFAFQITLLVIPFIVLIYAIKNTSLTWKSIGITTTIGNIKKSSAKYYYVFSFFILILLVEAISTSIVKFLIPINLLAMNPVEIPKKSVFVDFLVGFLIAIRSGFFEEIYFRGFLNLFFANKITFVIISSLLFGFMHWPMGLHSVVTSVLIGIVYSINYIRTGSLVPSIIAHTVYDLLLEMGKVFLGAA